ncbi:hypothetical protein HK098_002989 [Nowakowskiella sp. JEL0407]|nr:hypothetical protein HK098_002989 [Nowakowskiella sp. JEL0407]
MSKSISDILSDLDFLPFQVKDPVIVSSDNVSSFSQFYTTEFQYYDHKHLFVKTEKYGSIIASIRETELYYEVLVWSKFLNGERYHRVEKHNIELDQKMNETVRLLFVWQYVMCQSFNVSDIAVREYSVVNHSELLEKDLCTLEFIPPMILKQKRPFVIDVFGNTDDIMEYDEIFGSNIDNFLAIPDDSFLGRELKINMPKEHKIKSYESTFIRIYKSSADILRAKPNRKDRETTYLTLLEKSFQNFEELVVLMKKEHSALYLHVCERHIDPESETLVADFANVLLEKMKSVQNSYRLWASKYRIAIGCVQELRANHESEYRNVNRGATERVKSDENIDTRYENLLVEPIQRLPRYTMILTELLKCTPKTHQDYESITECATGLDKIILEIEKTQVTHLTEQFLKGLTKYIPDSCTLYTLNRTYLRDFRVNILNKGMLGYPGIMILFNDLIVVLRKKPPGKGFGYESDVRFCMKDIQILECSDTVFAIIGKDIRMQRQTIQFFETFADERIVDIIQVAALKWKLMFKNGGHSLPLYLRKHEFSEITNIDVFRVTESTQYRKGQFAIIIGKTKQELEDVLSATHSYYDYLCAVLVPDEGETNKIWKVCKKPKHRVIFESKAESLSNKDSELEIKKEDLEKELITTAFKLVEKINRCRHSDVTEHYAQKILEAFILKSFTKYALKTKHYDAAKAPKLIRKPTEIQTLKYATTLVEIPERTFASEKMDFGELKSRNSTIR